MNKLVEKLMEQAEGFQVEGAGRRPGETAVARSNRLQRTARTYGQLGLR